MNQETQLPPVSAFKLKSYQGPGIIDSYHQLFQNHLVELTLSTTETTLAFLNFCGYSMITSHPLKLNYDLTQVVIIPQPENVRYLQLQSYGSAVLAWFQFLVYQVYREEIQQLLANADHLRDTLDRYYDGQNSSSARVQYSTVISDLLRCLKKYQEDYRAMVNRVIDWKVNEEVLSFIYDQSPVRESPGSDLGSEQSEELTEPVDPTDSLGTQFSNQADGLGTQFSNQADGLGTQFANQANCPNLKEDWLEALTNYFNQHLTSGQQLSVKDLQAYHYRLLDQVRDPHKEGEGLDLAEHRLVHLDYHFEQMRKTYNLEETRLKNQTESIVFPYLELK